MLQTLYQLGLGQIQDISSLLTPIHNVNTTIGMVFENKDGTIRYVRSELFEFADEHNYLFRQIRGGKPGLFLTGTIPRKDITEINLTDNSKFIKKKILWFSHGKLVSDTSSDLFKSLSEYRQNELTGIFKELDSKSEEIAREVIQTLTHKLPEKTLLTIMIVEKEGQPKFVGQINDYVEFFARAMLYKKGQSEELVCNICNKQSAISAYEESPLPFFFSDKIHFFDNANVAKSLPVCGNCNIVVRRGIMFIQDNLDYRISSTQGKESGINFWLIPHLSDYTLLESFKNDLGSERLYYLDSLKVLCSTLESISTYDYEERQDNVEAFLRFSAVFYTLDREAFGLMRVLNYLQDIYPPQLRKLLEVKEKIDQLYPFRHIKREEFFVGLPLLVTFYKDIKPQWQSQVISMLNRMFTGQQIPIEEITQNINLRVHESLRKSNDLQLISRTEFMGLMLLEYVISLNNNESMHNDSDSSILMLNISTYETKHTERFIESHKSILNSETKQGVFAAGVSVAILFDVQEKKYGKTAPFWDKLSRLDLNLQKIVSLIPEVKRLLGVYKIRDHDTIINYLAVQHTIDPSVSISKDMVSYLFTLGLSFGYMLARHNLKDNGEEEVK